MKRTADISIPMAAWRPGALSAVVDAFLRRPSVEPRAERVARAVLSDVRRQGDRAVLRYAEEFDGCRLTASGLRVRKSEIAAARRSVDAAFKRAAREACGRIARFAKAGLRKDWSIASPKGGRLGERFVPLDRVGVYIPAGAAPLASTALMTITLARAAGVPEIVACSPADRKGRINPYVLYAMDLAGATEIYRIGGIPSIGAMAYGTATIGRVQKIVGPGGPYVTAAKKLVYGDVALDMLAGPSEIAVLADDSSSPQFVAADLLSQAEHGTGSEKVLLVTPSRKLARSVRDELVRQTATLNRRAAIRNVLEKGTLIAVVKDLESGMALCNAFAPEHLELLVRNPERWMKKVRAAGAIFLGPWTPESAGDFAAGPSHVLPTGGTAAMFSGLTVEDFRRRSSVIALTRADLKQVLPVIEAFGRVEGLDAHARSAQARFRTAN